MRQEAASTAASSSTAPLSGTQPDQWAETTQTQATRVAMEMLQHLHLAAPARPPPLQHAPPKERPAEPSFPLTHAWGNMPAHLTPMEVDAQRSIVCPDYHCDPVESIYARNQAFAKDRKHRVGQLEVLDRRAWCLGSARPTGCALHPSSTHQQAWRSASTHFGSSQRGDEQRCSDRPLHQELHGGAKHS